MTAGLEIQRTAYAQLRFAISPLWETVTSRWLLLPQPRTVAMLPWIPALREADAQLRPEHRQALQALLRAKAWMPDFITPMPSTPRPSIDQELATVRATDPEYARKDLLATELKRPLTAVGKAMADDPERWIPVIADALEQWWMLAVSPMWPRLNAVLEADVGYRATILAELGPRAALESLDPSIRLEGDTLHIGATKIPAPMRGHSLTQLTCTPSLMLSHHPTTNILPDLPTCLIYGARAPGTVWEQPKPGRTGSLGAVLGPTRAILLELCIAPHTTTRLAERANLTVPAVSMQMNALAAAGLVLRRREGRVVWHVVTDLGRSLLVANGVKVG